MPHDGSRIEPRLDLDELDTQVSRAAIPPTRSDPEEFDRQLARAKIPPKRAASPADHQPDADTIGFEPPQWTRGERPRPSMVPALVMLMLLGTAMAGIALYLT